MKCTGEKGAALLTVLVAMMIITILLFEFQYAAMVERKLSYNDLNQTQAYYLAKSGARMGLLRIVLYARLKTNPQLKQLPAGMDASSLNPLFDQIWQLPIPSFPPPKDKVGSMFKEDRDAAEKALSETKIADGNYSVTIKSESAKLNLNMLQVPNDKLNERPNFAAPPTTPYMLTATMLLNLINGFMRESDDPYSDYPNLIPEELIMDIMDWVSPGDARLAGGNKDSYYLQQTPPYRAKKNRFFTLEELRLVKGVDENIYEKLKPLVTVYATQGKININTADGKLFRALYADFTDDDIKRLLEYRTQMGGWLSEQSFVQYVTGTLNRTAFGTLYSNASQYPFTVGTESFMIESLGVIQKSASSVQRTVRVAVGLTAAQGCKDMPAYTQASDCTANAGLFWNTNFGKCQTKPTDAASCSQCAGQVQNNTCTILAYSGQGSPMSFPLSGAGTTTQGTTPTTGQPGSPPTNGTTPPSGSGSTAQTKPGALKIFYWGES